MRLYLAPRTTKAVVDGLARRNRRRRTTARRAQRRLKREGRDA